MHFKRVSGLLLGTMLLSGCIAERVLPFMVKPDDEITVTVAGTDVIIGNVAGYCVNKRQSKNTETTAFVVLGPCDPKTADTKALLIASITGEADFGADVTPAKLETFFQSEHGHKILSSANDPKSVEIQEMVQADGVLYVYVRDQAAPVIPDTVNDKWRGFFPISGRMVAISMVNFENNTVSAKRALRQLKTFAENIQYRNKAETP